MGCPRELENQRGGQSPLDLNTSEWGGASHLKTMESSTDGEYVQLKRESSSVCRVLSCGFSQTIPPDCVVFSVGSKMQH